MSICIKGQTPDITLCILAGIGWPIIMEHMVSCPCCGSAYAGTVLEAQFQFLKNPKLAFATATSNSDCLPQKFTQLDRIISYKINYKTKI